MRCAFNQAKKWQCIIGNPFLDATLPERKAKERPALTPSQLEEVFTYTDNKNRYDLCPIYVAMNLAFAWSMHRGEIAPRSLQNWETDTNKPPAHVVKMLME